MRIKSFAVIGTGAIGGYCAVRLSHAGYQTHCLLRSDFSHVHQHGLSLISNSENITVPVFSYEDIADMPICDVILVALKTTSNHLLKTMLPKLMHPQSLVVILQNGIGVEQEVAKFIKPENIIGGSCMLKVSKESPGLIRHFAFNSIELAQYYLDENRTDLCESVQELSEIFLKIKIDCVVNPHLSSMRWKKLAGNIPANGLAVLLDAYTKELVQNAASFSLLCELTQEVISVAKQCGALLPENFYQSRVNVLESFLTMENNYSSGSLRKQSFNLKMAKTLISIAPFET